MGNGGIVRESIALAVENIRQVSSHRPADVPARRRGPVGDPQSWRLGSSNFSVAARSARWAMGEERFDGEAQSHEKWLGEFYRRQLGGEWLLPGEIPLGHRVMEGMSTTYDPIHVGSAILVAWRAKTASPLYEAVREFLSREMAIAAAVSYPFRGFFRFAYCGARCTVAHSQSVVDVFRAGLGLTSIASPGQKLYAPVWLAERNLARVVGDTDGARAARAAISGDFSLLGEVLSRMRYAIGRLEILRFSSGGVVAAFPDSLRTAGVGGPKMSARRPFAVGLPGHRDPIAPRFRFGDLRSWIEGGEILAESTDGQVERASLPPGDVVATLEVQAL